jgi:hypothetical protein
MSASPSRRDVFRGLFAAGLAWLGLRPAAKAAPTVLAQPLTDAPSPLTACYYYDCDHSHCLTTIMYSAYSRLEMVEESFAVVTYTYDSSGGPPRLQPPQKR